MGEITVTPFGEGKRFIEVNHCVTLGPDDVEQIRAIVGAQDTRTLTMASPRPKCIPNDDDLLLVLRGINFNEGAEADDMVSVRIWLNADTIIASQNRNVTSVEAAEKALPKTDRPLTALINIIDGLFGRIESHILGLDERVDVAEERALAAPSKQIRLEIMEFRRSVIALRRYLLPQRETMMTLSRSTSALITDDDRQTLTDQYYRSARICDLLDAVRERLALIQEEITATISDRINQNMYLLSIISLIFLPLGFLTGLFGINVGGMPGVADGGDPVEPVAFWMVVAGCAVVAAGIFVTMKIKKWI